MTFSLREVSLGEVCEIKQGKYLAPNQMEENPTDENFVPVVGGNGVLGYTDQSTFSFPVPLVTCRGSKCGLMQWAEPPSNNAMAVYFKENQGDNFFLHQYLLNSSFDDVITGSAQPQITVTNLSLKRILIPDLETQRAISSFAKTIEGKIAINNALSKSLEEITKTIFKSWFMDFDPVKAKAAGEEPAGMDSETAALFPDSMEESELGLIPRGWSVSKLEKHIKVTKGKSYKSSELEPSKTALVTLKSFKRGGGYRFDGLKPFSGQYKPEQVVEPGELVVSFTDVTQAADVIGKPAIVFQDPRFSTLVASLDVGIVRTIGNQFSMNYLYQLFLTPDFKNHTDGYTNGTTVLHLGKGALENYLAASPGEKLMSKYDDIAGAFQSQMQLYQLENLALKEIRDSLLPRLISGELEIPQNAWAV
jgi:type I restriction enzyme S subunit